MQILNKLRTGNPKKKPHFFSLLCKLFQFICYFIQKRVRHIQSIAARNITWKDGVSSDLTEQKTPSGSSDNTKNDALLLNTYFTFHWNTFDPAFYTSEIISNTRNPTFRLLSKPHSTDWFGYSLNFMIIRLWGKRTSDKEKDYRLIVEWHLDLNLLVKIGNSASKKLFIGLWSFLFFFYSFLI